MGENRDIFGMLELMLRPGFCVKENIIQKVNAAAGSLPICPGGDVRDFLRTGQEEYATFEGGCLYLQLSLPPHCCGASVTRVDGWDVFVLDSEGGDSSLQALALASSALRTPVNSVLLAASQLQSLVDPTDPKVSAQTAQLSRSLHQILRLLGNMSDAGRFASGSSQVTQDLSQCFSEILEKAQTLLSCAGFPLTYQVPSEPIWGLADMEQLERAILNLLSNAVKFSPKGGSIHASLTRKNRMLYFRVQDDGSGMPESILGNVFNRYLRHPGIEDVRYGLGLGMALVRAAAANHGGAVLLDQPSGKGTRITMTLAIRQSTDSTLRSPVLRPDYAGGWDHALIELSDCLPLSAYELE